MSHNSSAPELFATPSLMLPATSGVSSMHYQETSGDIFPAVSFQHSTARAADRPKASPTTTRRKRQVNTEPISTPMATMTTTWPTTALHDLSSLDHLQRLSTPAAMSGANYHLNMTNAQKRVRSNAWSPSSVYDQPASNSNGRDRSTGNEFGSGLSGQGLTSLSSVHAAEDSDDDDDDEGDGGAGLQDTQDNVGNGYDDGDDNGDNDDHDNSQDDDHDDDDVEKHSQDTQQLVSQFARGRSNKLPKATSWSLSLSRHNLHQGQDHDHTSNGGGGLQRHLSGGIPRLGGVPMQGGFVAPSKMNKGDRDFLMRTLALEENKVKVEVEKIALEREKLALERQRLQWEMRQSSMY
ncbi:hypothetical protein BGZ98_006848 [Dissophora globulifera]|nr:hypothetical protein BGZ98_006848 [Dissophora globulifera]